MNQIFNALSSAKIYDLAQPFQKGMPQSPNHPPFRMVLERRHGDLIRPDGGSASNEIIVTGAHVGTHIDGLAHVSQDGKMFGGINAYEVQSADGFSELGIETMTPFIGRGVLLDIAGLKGEKFLPAGYGISADDLAAAEKRAGVKEADNPEFVFYRDERAPDTQIPKGTVSNEVIKEVKALWFTGSTLAIKPLNETVSEMVVTRARKSFTIFDLDYRPSFWPDRSSAHLAINQAMSLADVAIGNIEECRVATY